VRAVTDTARLAPAGVTLEPPTSARSTTRPQERLRVLLFVNSVAIGGMEEHVELLARLLDRERFEVFAVSPRSPATEALHVTMREAADHADVVTPDRRHGIRRETRELLRLAQLIRKWRIDVVHMHSTTYLGQSVALAAARLGGVRTVYVTEHLAPDASLPWYRRLSRTLFSMAASGIVCVSEKNYLARQQHIYTPAKRTIVVPNGVDVRDFTPVPAAQLVALRASLDLPVNAKIVGTAIRFEPGKGVDDLVGAFPAILADCPDAYLLMLGDGLLRPDLERQADALGIRDRVRFAGFQSDPRPYIQLMDAFVLPVPVGSMSIGLLEAMAMERAVVITFGGKGEAVIHGESGFCAEPRNPASIAAHVIQILRDPQLQRRFGAAARARVEAHFSAQQVARVLGALYHRGVPGAKALASRDA
jgi:glycogen synthase